MDSNKRSNSCSFHSLKIISLWLLLSFNPFFHFSLHKHFLTNIWYCFFIFIFICLFLFVLLPHKNLWYCSIFVLFFQWVCSFGKGNEFVNSVFFGFILRMLIKKIICLFYFWWLMFSLVFILPLIIWVVWFLMIDIFYAYNLTQERFTSRNLSNFLKGSLTRLNYHIANQDIGLMAPFTYMLLNFNSFI